MSICSENNTQAIPAPKQSNYVSFTDFIVQYHKIPHSDLSLVNKIEFTMKKRSLVHQLCFNIHTHLLRSLMNMPEVEPCHEIDLFGYDINAGYQNPPQDLGNRLIIQKSDDTTDRDNYEQILTSRSDGKELKMQTAEAAIAKVINLNKKDTQGVVPLCLLVMNMTPIERHKEKPKLNESNQM